MIIRTCAFTDKGRALAVRLESALDNFIWEHKKKDTETDQWIKECFEIKAPIVFIGASGIAVRKIAPYVTDKLTDSSVVVIDEKGKYVIPLLSGHVGRANELASELAASLGAEAVITTATDVEDLFSVDVFAVKNGLSIVNREGIKSVSSKLLRGGKISIAMAPQFEYCTDDIPQCIELVSYDKREMADVVIVCRSDERDINTDPGYPLILEAKPYVLGVGCKKDTDSLRFEENINSIIGANGIERSDICAMASIDLKSKEYAPNYYETKYRIPFRVYSAEELQEVEGDFAESDFVKSITGVSNVCERAAIRCAGKDAKLVVRKNAKDGITVAVAKKTRWVITWET